MLAGALALATGGVDVANANGAAVAAIKAAAQRYHLDPQAMIAVARAESGLNPKAVGDGGHAFGLFQFNNAGGVITGQPNPERYLDPGFNAMEAARHIASIKGATSAKGAEAVKLIVNQFERPLNKPGEISRALSYLGKDSIPSPTVLPKVSQTVSNGLSGQTNTTGQNQSNNVLGALLQTAMTGSAPSHDPGQDQSAALLPALLQMQQADQIPTPTVGATTTTPLTPTGTTGTGAGVTTTPGTGRTVTVDGHVLNLTPGKTWGGSQSIANQFRDLAKANGLSVMSEKRNTEHTTSGGVSDHWVGSKNSYAFDMSNGSQPTPEMDKYAAETAAALGAGAQWKKQGSKGILNVVKDGYRYQMLYRITGAANGGNHMNHVHLGVKKV